jgi:hypothetical protein
VPSTVTVTVTVTDGRRLIRRFEEMPARAERSLTDGQSRSTSQTLLVIGGRTDSLREMRSLFSARDKAAYGRTRLFDLVTTDAGNTSLAVACLIVALGWNYFAQIKSVQGAIFEEAERALGNRPDEDADASYVDTQNGQIISYHLWRYDLGEDGWLDWTHARQLGVLIVSALRMMALAILSVARLLTRIEYSVERPTWAQVAGHFLLELCDSILETEAFDNV